MPALQAGLLDGSTIMSEGHGWRYDIILSSAPRGLLTEVGDVPRTNALDRTGEALVVVGGRRPAWRPCCTSGSA